MRPGWASRPDAAACQASSCPDRPGRRTDNKNETRKGNIQWRGQYWR
jgi:hypothetical protein